MKATKLSARKMSAKMRRMQSMRIRYISQCNQCGEKMHSIIIAKYCSTGCRSKAWRVRTQYGETK